MAYSDFEKVEAFKDTPEVTFQENAEPYSDDKIEEVESLVNHYFDNFNTHIPSLTSPLEVRGIIKNYDQSSLQSHRLHSSGTMRVPGGPFYATPIDTCH
ncbi:hypothetical protein TNCV_1221031 [Trichonephila clavipes]|nr:hypothetical protein TNCV_1221031 [Trichonephila clavipes]